MSDGNGTYLRATLFITATSNTCVHPTTLGSLTPHLYLLKAITEAL